MDMKVEKLFDEAVKNHETEDICKYPAISEAA